ncbi:MAG: ArsC family reductase [Alphaproteobacteria bacterium]|nr:ArsC family reductase [Alphaproteobacteria bacterium]
MVTVYGLKNCDTCRKARQWMEAEGIAHRFHDVRADELAESVLAGWAAELGWETLLNRRGTTWRQLPENEKENLDKKRAVALMAAHPALIKRPVFDLGVSRLVGFGKTEQEALRTAG